MEYINPELSVVIPTYNRRYYLDKCLNSLFQQNYPLSKYEVIVVDDNSLDNTSQMLQKYLKKYPNLQVIRNKQNKGSYYARTLGVKRAGAGVIVFTDSDCLLPHDWLRKIANKFESSEVLCVQGSQECEGKWGRFMHEREELIMHFKRRNMLDTKNLAIRKNIFLKYNFDLSCGSVADLELGQRISKDIKIHYESNIYVIHISDNFSSSFTRGKNWGQGAAYIYEKHGLSGINPKFKYPLIFL